MQIVTVATDTNDRRFIDYLQSSCEFNQLELVVLEYDDTFFSNRLKDILLFEYLKELDNDEIIVFSDAVDAAFLSKEPEILNKFRSFNAPLVFSAEINCWPDRKLESIYPPSIAHFRYLNSGGFIGTAGFIKSIYNKYPIFETAIDNHEWSNQYYWNYVFIQESDSIKLDHNCDIFYNTSMWVGDLQNFATRLRSPEEVESMFDSEKKRLDSEIVFTEDRIKNNITNSFPCHIHFPGPISKLLVERGYFSTLSKRTTAS